MNTVNAIAYLKGNTEDEIGPTMEMLREYNLRKYNPEELEDLTSNFSEANLIGETQFGKVYRGKTQQGQDVTVKVWEDKEGRFPVGRHEHCSQLTKECIFLMESSVNHHPNLVKLMGYCCEDSLLGVVFDLKPVDTVRNLIVKDGFSWLHRIKVAIDRGAFFEILHWQNPRYLVRNIGPAHIMLDQDYNPVLFDFGMLVGGVFGDKQPRPNKYVHGSLGYFDPAILWFRVWGMEHDIFSFGCVLLELISKRVFERKEDEPPFCWAKAEYNQQKPKISFFGFSLLKKFSLVHKSFEEDLGFSRHDGYKITELAMRCVEGFGLDVRPTMKEVVQSLESLHAVCGHGKNFDCSFCTVYWNNYCLRS